jgi:hypothetical protein
MYWFWLSTVRNAISLLWSVGKMKLRVAGAAAGVGQRALVEQDHVGPAESAEVPDEAVTDDAGADDDDLCCRRHGVGNGGALAHCCLLEVPARPSGGA